jgi:hypothetical protein
MDRIAIHDRARRVRQIERLTTSDSPPDPKKMSHAVHELLALADAPQDRVQRAARERLITACKDYEIRNMRANDQLAAAVRNTWCLFEMMWRDDRGRMIPPDFLTRDWKDPAARVRDMGPAHLPGP